MLCRARCVCQEWNSIICTPEFGALYIQRAPELARTFGVVREQSRSWSFLAMDERHWYTIDHKLNPEVYGTFTSIRSTAMDGGLVCQCLKSYFDFGTEQTALVVSNPITGTHTRLPFWGERYEPVLTMVADTIAHTYKVFMMPHKYGNRDEFVSVFQSTTNQWRDITFPYRPPIGFDCCGEYSIFFDGLLYVFVSICDATAGDWPFWTFQYVLWAFNDVDDTWKDLGIEIPMVTHFEPELIVCNCRLFLASWMHPNALGGDFGDFPLFETWSEAGWSYAIHEVHLDEKALTTVFQKTSAVMAELGSVKVKAVNYLHSIVLVSDYSSDGHVLIVYHMRTSWVEVIPTCPIIPAHDSRQGILANWCGSTTMNLTLPQWDHPQHGSSVRVRPRGSFRRFSTTKVSSNILEEPTSSRTSRVDVIKEGPQVGNVEFYDRHLFLHCGQPESWPLTEDPAGYGPLPSKLVKALRSKKSELPKKTRLTIADGRKNHEKTNGDILVFPDMMQYKRIAESDVESYVDGVLMVSTGI